MGITIRREAENGSALAVVEDPRNPLHLALPAPEDPQFVWAGAIDWYGDTTFNRVQAAKLHAELLCRIEELLKRRVSRQAWLAGGARRVCSRKRPATARPYCGATQQPTATCAARRPARSMHTHPS